MCILYDVHIIQKKKKKVRSLLITIKIRDVREGMINPRCVCSWACVRVNVCARAALVYTPFLPCPVLSYHALIFLSSSHTFLTCTALPNPTILCLALHCLAVHSHFSPLFRRTSCPWPAMPPRTT